ncbi:MAG: prepilin-type N-terminal cleavage/methylation domain-containing protein [Clostridiales bacterium]|nr:prepilin-type N-terminal cleavage/methylation domain-containing protein [Clostridiales bacterium]
MKNLTLTKKFNRGFSLVEVVVSMALILLISFSAISACMAFSSVINNSKKTATIISYSQASLNCINSSINNSTNYDGFFESFESSLTFCFNDKVSVSKNHNGLDADNKAIAYELVFDCGLVEVLFVQATNSIQAQINGYTARSNNAVYTYSRSYNFV